MICTGSATASRIVSSSALCPFNVSSACGRPAVRAPGAASTGYPGGGAAGRPARRATVRYKLPCVVAMHVPSIARNLTVYRYCIHDYDLCECYYGQCTCPVRPRLACRRPGALRSTVSHAVQATTTSCSHKHILRSNKVFIIAYFCRNYNLYTPSLQYHVSHVLCLEKTGRGSGSGRDTSSVGRIHLQYEYNKAVLYSSVSKVEGVSLRHL